MPLRDESLSVDLSLTWNQKLPKETGAVCICLVCLLFTFSVVTDISAHPRMEQQNAVPVRGSLLASTLGSL